MVRMHLFRYTDLSLTAVFQPNKRTYVVSKVIPCSLCLHRYDIWTSLNDEIFEDNGFCLHERVEDLQSKADGVNLKPCILGDPCVGNKLGRTFM